MTEGSLKTAVMKRLKQERHSITRKLHGSPFAVAGDPDILFVRQRGHGDTVVELFAIELKVPGEKATPIQEQRLVEWRDAGATGFVAHSVAEVLAGIGLA